MASPPAVLIIDDEANFARILEAKLRRASFDVEIVRDAAGALAALLRHRYDLCLLDAYLAGTDGVALLPKLCAAAPQTPFVLMTADRSEEQRTRAVIAGAADVIAKPFDLDLLIDTVRLYISGQPTRFAAYPPQFDSTVVVIGRPIRILTAGPSGQEPALARVTTRQPDLFGALLDGPHGFVADQSVVVETTGDDALYRFRARIVEVGERGRVVITRPRVIRRLQRRKHPRTPTHVPATLVIVAAPPPSTANGAGRAKPSRHAGRAAAPGIAVAATCTDVSVGGMGLVTAIPMPVGAPVRATWASEDGGSPLDALTARGRIIRSEEIQQGGCVQAYRVGVRFTGLSQNARAALAALAAPPRI